MFPMLRNLGVVRWGDSCSNPHEINYFAVMTKSCSVAAQTTEPDNFSSV
jgi:hypothetical protein